MGRGWLSFLLMGSCPVSVRGLSVAVVVVFCAVCSPGPAGGRVPVFRAGWAPPRSFP